MSEKDCFPIPINKFVQSTKQKKARKFMASSPMAQVLKKTKTNYVTITIKSKQQKRRQNMK